MTNKEMDTQNTPVFDPLAWTTSEQGNDNSAKPSTPARHQPAACQPLSHREELAKARAVARELVRKGGNIADDYRDYLKLGFALANGLGSDGRELYHMLCAQSSKYRSVDCERKWQECMSKADGRTSIATFYHMARMAGVDISEVAREIRRELFYSY